MNPYIILGGTLCISQTKHKRSTNTLMELFSNVNPCLKEWTDALMASFSLDPDSWKDYVIDGWYIPAYRRSARRYYSSWQFKHWSTTRSQESHLGPLLANSLIFQTNQISYQEISYQDLTTSTLLAFLLKTL